MSDTQVTAPVAPPRGHLKTWLKAIRIHQWVKNLLIFTPIVTAHEVFSIERLKAGALAFLAFGLVASATYLVNDILDVEADRAHSHKRYRPIASGVIGVPAALAVAAAMLGLGVAVAMQLPWLFIGALLSYIVTTLLYSAWLKRVASLDVVLLAGLYTLRVIAGALATGIALSFWLLAFSVFLFLCLALAKRVAELVDLTRRTQAGTTTTTSLRGRQYGLEDIQVLQIMGTVSGYIAVLVLALYINSPEVAALYAAPEILWLIAPAMLLWVSRLWMVTSRGYMHEDPVLFAIKDPETWATAAFAGAVLLAAKLLHFQKFP